MSESQIRNRMQKTRWVGITALILLLSAGTAPAGAQTPRVRVVASHGAVVVGPELGQQVYVPSTTAWGGSMEGGQPPQDIRIMQRILSTALGEVEAPELPEELKEGSGSEGGTSVYTSGVGPVVVPAGSSGRAFYIGGRDITGFYMQGYGYLFTVNWRISDRLGHGGGAWGLSAAELDSLALEARRAAENATAAEARAAGEASDALEARRADLEVQQRAWEQWAGRYRDELAEELRRVVALYGNTLSRAQPDESITILADFGGGESETVTVSARRSDLTGAGQEQNLAAVQLARGEAGISEGLRTELKIMSAILDSSTPGEDTSELPQVVYSGRFEYLDGNPPYQYVPGYGVLFRKAARLNLATRLIREVVPPRSGADATPQTLRQRIEESTEDQRETYSEHLAALKESTAEILATYGPTLTEMNGDEWVGVYYDVGSAAGLLQGGITNYLVQARMRDIRTAANQSDPASWLTDHLVTNERQE